MRPDNIELQELFQTAMKTYPNMTLKLDSVEDLGIDGSCRITVTVRPKDAKKIDPFAVGGMFTIKKRSYEVVGVNFRWFKFPVIVKRLPDGKRFKVSTQTVIDGYLGMRNE